MKITNKDIIWSYLSQIFQIGASLFILPIILKKLSSEEIGIWYIFMSFSALINLLDFGLAPTFSRNISYIFSGVQNLVKEGTDIECSDKINYKLLKNTIYSVRYIYIQISLIIAILFNTVGIIYINSILKTSKYLEKNTILLAWMVFVISLAFNYYYYYYTPMLLGRGLIKESHKTIVYTKIGYIVIAYILVEYNLGLLGIALANLISSLINRISSHFYFYDKKIKEILKNENNDKIQQKKIIKIMLKNSSKLGIVYLGAFLINKSSILIMSKFMNLEVIAKYGITLQVTSLLVTISSVLFNTYLPLINYLRIQKDNIEILNIFSKGLFINYLLYIFGSLFLILFGNKLLIIVRSNTLLLENKYLIILLIINFLEMNHSIAATMITTKNIIPFLKPSLISGVLIVILTVISLKYTKLEIYGVLLSQGVVQLIYNNWKWPVEISKDLSTNYLSILKIGMKSLFNEIKRR